MSVGGSQYVKLCSFGMFLHEVFGEQAYQVGSSVDGKNWRDVDVVVMLSNDCFWSWAGTHGFHGARWKGICAAFSALGKEMTGLPIDFKIQPVKWANERYPGARNAIGMRIYQDFVDPDFPPTVRREFPKAVDDLLNILPIPT